MHKHHILENEGDQALDSAGTNCLNCTSSNVRSKGARVPKKRVEDQQMFQTV